jgi:putative salt-induced outer membrane protein YdiY
MSMKSRIGAIGIACLFPFFFHPAHADEVRLKNGDRYSGKIIRIEKERLTLETDLMEKRIEINWEHVECIASEKDVAVVLQDDEVWIGRVICPRPGMFQLQNDKLGVTKELSLAELKAVNPAVYKGYFNLGGNYTDGNTNTSAVNLATRLEIRTRRHRFTAEAKYNYGETDGTTSVRNGTGFLKYDLFFTDKIYSYAQTLLERDDFANLNLRATQGLGLGYQFFDTRRTNCYVEAGISYYNEDVVVGEDKSGASGRWGVNLEHEIVEGKLKAFHRQEGYYNFNTASVYFRTEQGLRVPFWKELAGFFEVDWKYNSDPDDGKKKSDTFIILGLSYEYAYW